MRGWNERIGGRNEGEKERRTAGWGPRFRVCGRLFCSPEKRDEVEVEIHSVDCVFIYGQYFDLQIFSSSHERSCLEGCSPDLGFLIVRHC